MDKIVIKSVVIRKLLEAIITRWLKQKGIGGTVIFTDPIEIVDHETGYIDVDVKADVRMSIPANYLMDFLAK